MSDIQNLSKADLAAIISAAKKQGVSLEGEKQQIEESTTGGQVVDVNGEKLVLENIPANEQREELSDDIGVLVEQAINKSKAKATEDKEELGLVVSKDTIEQIQKKENSSGIKLTNGVNTPEFNNNLTKYLSGMEDDIKDAVAHGATVPILNEDNTVASVVQQDEEGEVKTTPLKYGDKNIEADPEVEEEETEDDEDIFNTDDENDEFNKKYKEVKIILDKRNMDTVVFSEAEAEKIQHAKKITLEEVETVNVETMKVKKRAKGESLKTILKRTIDSRTITLPLPISGMVVTLEKASTLQLITLLDNRAEAVTSMQAKWSFIHSKVVDTSIGKLDFDPFLKKVAQVEFDLLVYGLLCVSYPEDDIFPLVCPKCKTNYNHKYKINELIRYEEMGDRLKELFMDTVDNTITAEGAKEVNEKAPLNTSVVKVLPDSKIRVEFAYLSAYDYIESKLKAAKEMPAKYQQAANLSTMIYSLYIPDSDGYFFRIEDNIEIVETLFGLSDMDMAVISMQHPKQAELQFSFGLMNVQCPNNKCRKIVNTLPVDIGTILFQRCQKAINTAIE